MKQQPARPKAWKRTWQRREGDPAPRDTEGGVTLTLLWRVVGVGSLTQLLKWIIWLTLGVGVGSTL